MNRQFGREMVAMRVLVRSILTHAPVYTWTVQGFGMLRTYLDEREAWRLNIWDSSLRTENVSDIHDHPWDFESWIIFGSLCNIRYRSYSPGGPYAATHYRGTIRTGEGGGLEEGSQTKVCLIPQATESYPCYGHYHQVWHEIHRTHPVDGTVTLNYRVPRQQTDGVKTADVFWDLDQTWIDAEPRPAEMRELMQAIDKVFDRNDAY